VIRLDALTNKLEHWQVEERVVQVVFAARVASPIVMDQVARCRDVEFRQDEAVETQHERLIVGKFEHRVTSATGVAAAGIRLHSAKP
jgi:hypothetical protein